jgi:hypothetical protein
VYSLTQLAIVSQMVFNTLSDMFRPFYNGHLQASMLVGVVNTTVIRNIRDLVSCARTAVCHHMLLGIVVQRVSK